MMFTSRIKGALSGVEGRVNHFERSREMANHVSVLLHLQCVEFRMRGEDLDSARSSLSSLDSARDSTRTTNYDAYRVQF